jgi:hypothetical protein
MKVEKDEWALEKRVKIHLRYIEAKKFYPARCVEGYHVALQHQVTVKEVLMATGSLLIKSIIGFFLYVFL